MKIVVEETLTKYNKTEGSIFESEQKRVALQKEYEQVIPLSLITFIEFGRV